MASSFACTLAVVFFTKTSFNECAVLAEAATHVRAATLTPLQCPPVLARNWLKIAMGTAGMPLVIRALFSRVRFGLCKKKNSTKAH
jgi:hypothetical protein